MTLYFPSSILPTCCVQTFQWGVDQIKKPLINFFPKVHLEKPKENLNRNFANLTNMASFEKLILSINKEDLTPLNMALDGISLAKLTSILQKENPLLTDKDVNMLVKILSEFLPEEIKSVASLKSQAHQSGNTKFLTTFFPNLVHVFMRAFDLLNSDRPPESLYEYGVLVTLYINFFSIPYHLIYALNSLIGNPLQVLAIASLIMAASIGALYGYVGYLKKCPSQVTCCENLTAKGESVKVRGFEDKYEEMKTYFGTKDNGSMSKIVVLVGKPGVGKTEFMNGLPEQFPGFQIFKFDNESLYGGSGSIMNAAGIMKIAFKDIQGNEDKVIFCYDEFNQALKNESMEIFFQSKLPRMNIQFVAAMTEKQWEELKIKSKGTGLEARFKPIFFEPTSDEQTKIILANRARRKSIDITDHALQRLIQITNQQEYDSEQPRKAIDAFDALAGRVSQFKIDSYMTPELRTKYNELIYLQSKVFESNSPIFTQESFEYFSAIEKLKSEIVELNKSTEKQKDLGKKIKKCLDYLKVYREQRIALVRLFKQKGSLEELDQKKFLFANFFAIPKLQLLIEKIEKKLNKDIYVRINEAIVEKFSEGFKK